MNKENLLKLAAYLDTLPLDYEHFEMEDFMQGGDAQKYALYATENGGVGVTTCGAVACAVGHGPSAGFLFEKNELEKDCIRVLTDDGNSYEWVDILKPDWHAYTGRVFVDSGSSLFDFMFGGGWSGWDNTPCGAAARIRFGVENFERYTEEEFHYLYCDRDTDCYESFVAPAALEYWKEQVNA